MTETKLVPHPGKLLRYLIKRDGCVAAPGAFNALVGRAVARAGFEACYISGGATANVAGYPDIGLITLTEMCIIRTSIEYERAGAAGMHIEDQVFPKRCGHLGGKQLLPTGDMVDKVREADKAKIDPNFILIARTDAYSVDGFDAAVQRANAYRDAGADMIFPEGLATEDEFEQFAKECPGPLLANMTEFGKTPMITFDRFKEMEYSLVIYPLSMMRLAMGHVERGLRTLKSEGSVVSLLDQMQTRQELYDALDYTPGAQWNYPGRAGRDLRDS